MIADLEGMMQALANIDEEKTVTTFQNEDFGTIRTLVIDGEPWFVAKDVCDILGVNNPRQATSRLEKFEKNTVSLNDGNKGNPNMTIISESGFYALVLSSRKAVAKPFRIWVTSEVLPSIRKTGKYQAPGHKMDGLVSNIGEQKIIYVMLNNIETMMCDQKEITEAIIDNMTISTGQQKKLQEAVKNRVRALLKGKEDVRNGKRYSFALWKDLKEQFECGESYRDLNPKYFALALDFISEWNYKK